jgi:murein L,D-transpeptidase YcbB/YkuD
MSVWLARNLFLVVLTAAGVLGVWAGRPAEAAEDPASAIRAMLLQPAMPAGLPSSNVEVLRRIYYPRGYAPLWIEGAGVASRTSAVHAALQAVRFDGHPDTAALLEAIGSRLTGGNVRRLAELDVLLTTALARFGAAENADPEAAAALVASVAASPRLAGALRQALPASPDYWRLRAASARYRDIAAAGGWPRLPGTAKLALGVVDPSVVILRQRLAVTGELPADLAATAEVFDAGLDAAVRRFQGRHGLLVDGIVGPKTRAALNVPVEARLALMALNLERLRHLSARLEPTYAIVNVAAAEFRLIEGGATVLRRRVIVGRPTWRTPELHSAITKVELYPYWNVPPRIARTELVPKIRRDPGYLARHAIRVLSSWGPQARELDPRAVDWSGGAYRLRQEPGPSNALGLVKFHIPNPFDVYLHDTPSKELFARPERFFSHGCIRLEQPLDLARYLLRSVPAWSGGGIDQALAFNRNMTIDLSVPLPIHVVYLTAWADESGIVQFRDDVYRRDHLPPGAVASKNVDSRSSASTECAASRISNGAGAA